MSHTSAQSEDTNKKPTASMKVLIATGVFPPESGGPATYSKTLLSMLPTHGIEVEVLPFRKVRKYPKVIRHVVYFFFIIRCSRGVDLVYAQDPVSVGLPVALSSFFTKKRFVLKVVGDYAWEQSIQRFGYTGTVEQFQKEENLTFMPEFLRSIERWVGKRALQVVVPSKYLGRIVGRWGVPKKNISVIYNGTEQETVGLKQVIRGLLKFKGKLVVSVGRLVPWKGYDALIRVHEKLKKEIPELTLLIVGSGPEQEKLERLVESKGIVESVIFTGRVERDVALRYMRAADVFVLNTQYEGFSHLLLEAAVVGVPIVTTNVGGNPEFIENGVNGFLIKPDDEKALVHHVKTLITSPSTRTQIVTNAKKKVGTFSNKRMVEQTAALLTKLCV